MSQSSSLLANGFGLIEPRDSRKVLAGFRLCRQRNHTSRAFEASGSLVRQSIGDIMDNQANGFELGAWTFTLIVFVAGMVVHAVFF